MTEFKFKPMLSPTHRLHFIGIGGSGMAPLAEVAFHSGYQVSGSDSSASDVTQYLQNLGIPISIGNSSKNISPSENPTVIYSSAVKEENPEFQEAFSHSLPLMHRSDLLNFFISEKPKAVTVAGTNGKSTTSSMLSYILHHLGRKPLAVVGAKLRDLNTLSLWGDGEYAVAEADESDGTFLKYHPFVGVLTSIDFDHMDYYRDQSHIFQTFEKYISNIVPEGSAVLNIDDPDCLKIFQTIKGNKIAYGFTERADIQASNYIYKSGESYFSVDIHGKSYNARLKTIGKHNVENALASIASACALGLGQKDVIDTLENFSGVKRRLELIFKSPDLAIYDDYAHNPTKIKSVLGAVRFSSPESRLIVIFQPHRHTRLKTLYNNFIGSFLDADFVMVLPTYSSGELDENPIPSERLVADIQNISHVPCSFAPSFESAKEQAVHLLKKDSIIITLGAGDIWHLAFALKERLS